jgi:hypothetical protein
MACHVVREHAAASPPVFRLRAHPRRVAVVGQPNVGKSVGGAHGQHLSAMTRGCLAGTAVCFNSNEGESLCGGCRARAYAATGSFLTEEPFCTYRPELDVARGSSPVSRVSVAGLPNHEQRAAIHEPEEQSK